MSDETSEIPASVDKTAQPKKEAVLAALVETGGNISKAIKAAKVSRSAHYLWIDNDPDYAAAFQKAMRRAADVLESEAVRRAVEGTLKPVYQGGEKVGTIREYSDTLLIFMLKGARPEKYRERVENVHTVDPDKPFVVKVLKGVSMEDL